MILLSLDFPKEQVISHRLFGMHQKSLEWVTARELRTSLFRINFRPYGQEWLTVRGGPLSPGIAIADDGKVYIVARYSPPGNIIGQYEENVQALSATRVCKLMMLLFLLSLTI